MTTGKRLGTVTIEEKDAIQRLHERKGALAELLKSVSTGGSESAEFRELYEKIVEDMGKTQSLYTSWWTRMREKYSWEDIPGMRWHIEFETCEVVLVGENGGCCEH